MRAEGLTSVAVDPVTAISPNDDKNVLYQSHALPARPLARIKQNQTTAWKDITTALLRLHRPLFVINIRSQRS